MSGAGYRAYGAYGRRHAALSNNTSRQRSDGSRPLDSGDGYGVHARCLFDGEQVTTDV